jgi:hypothetical protein
VLPKPSFDKLRRRLFSFGFFKEDEIAFCAVVSSQPYCSGSSDVEDACANFNAFAFATRAHTFVFHF